MKIGIVCYPTLGGSGIVATELGHALAEKGFEIHFIAYQIPFRLHLERENIFFHEVGINQYDLFQYPDYAITLAVKIAEVVKEYQIDILHVHYAIPHAASAFLAKQLLEKHKIAVVTTLHGTDITLVGRDPAYFEMVKFSIEKSDGITAVSNNLKEQTCQYFGIHRDIQVIYNFFNPRPELIGKKNLRCQFVKPEEKLILHSSNFRYVKRVPDVIHIFEKLRKKIPAKLVLLGHGSGVDEIRDLVNSLGLQKEVFFLGKSRDVDLYVSSADLFLLPSAHESFGLSALEAMAYGVPVIASDTGGIPEVVLNGVTGYLSPIGNVHQMADHALHILTHPDEYERMSKACMERATNHFSVEKILPQYVQYYLDCINRLV